MLAVKGQSCQKCQPDRRHKKEVHTHIKKLLTGPQSGTLSVCPKYILVKSSLLFRLADLDLEQTEPEPFITSFIDIKA